MSEGFDLCLVHCRGNFGCSHDADHARSLQDGKTVLWVEAAEQVTRKQRKRDVFHPVGPFPPALVRRQEPFKPLALQVGSHVSLVASPHLKRKPGETRALVGRVQPILPGPGGVRSASLNLSYAEASHPVYPRPALMIMDILIRLEQAT